MISSDCFECVARTSGRSSQMLLLYAACDVRCALFAREHNLVDSTDFRIYTPRRGSPSSLFAIVVSRNSACEQRQQSLHTCSRTSSRVKCRPEAMEEFAGSGA